MKEEEKTSEIHTQGQKICGVDEVARILTYIYRVQKSVNIHEI